METIKDILDEALLIFIISFLGLAGIVFGYILWDISPIIVVTIVVMALWSLIISTIRNRRG